MTSTLTPAGLAPRPAGRAESGAAAGLRGAVAFEWTKLVSLRSTWYLLLVAVAVLGLAAPGIGVTLHDPAASPSLPAALATLYGAGVVVAALAMLSVTGEYATGGIATTLQCVPDRFRFLLAKCLVLGGVSFVTGLALGAAGTGLGALSLDESTFRATEVVGRVLAIGVYTVLLSVLTLGLSVVVRSSAGALTALFLLLFIVPALLGMVPGEVCADIATFLPQGAGEQLIGGATDYGPGIALPLLAAWALVSVIVAGQTLRRRDA